MRNLKLSARLFVKKDIVRFPVTFKNALVDIQSGTFRVIVYHCLMATVHSQPLIHTHTQVGKWDLLIAHPPCTYMTNAGAVRMRVNGVIQKDRFEKAMEAKDFFMSFYNADCERICIENPTPMKLVGLPPYTQAIQPYQFGHPYSKRTCLWLKNLPLLIPTNILDHHEPYVNGGCKDAHGNYRRFQGRGERDPKTRSKTFSGIAEAFADQWGNGHGEAQISLFKEDI